MTDIPDGYMRDAKANLIPIGNVKPEHMAEDELVKDLVVKAEALSAALGAFRARAMDDIEAFRDLVAEKYDAKVGGRKGNATLTTYDGRWRIRVAVSDTLSFGPELDAAKALIDSCVMRWSDGANDNLKVLVNDAFQVNKVGRIDTNRVLGLRRLDMGGDAEWGQAMEAIGDAVRTASSKTYLRVYKVDPKSGVETPLALDLANA